MPVLPNPEIRPAVLGDLSALVRLNAQVQTLHAIISPLDFKAHADEDDLRAFICSVLEAPGQAIEVAEIDGQTLGYIWFEIQDRPETALTHARKALFLQQICVDTAHRRQGIASALMRRLEAAAKTLDAEEIALGTWSQNTQAQAFFAACGFETITLLQRKSPA